jgi:hypothetical protein
MWAAIDIPVNEETEKRAKPTESRDHRKDLNQCQFVHMCLASGRLLEEALPSMTLPT